MQTVGSIIDALSKHDRNMRLLVKSAAHDESVEIRCEEEMVDFDKCLYYLDDIDSYLTDDPKEDAILEAAWDDPRNRVVVLILDD